MPAKPKTYAKYLGDGSEYHNGIPSRDLTEDEFAALTDEQQAMLAESKLYDLKHDAPAMAEKAGKRAEKAEPVVDAPFMAAPAPKDEPAKDEAKKP